MADSVVGAQGDTGDLGCGPLLHQLRESNTCLGNKMRTSSCLAVLLTVSDEAFRSGRRVGVFLGKLQRELVNPWAERQGVFRMGGSLSPEVSRDLAPAWD